MFIKVKFHYEEFRRLKYFKFEVIIICVALQRRKNTLKINTIRTNKIFKIFYKRKKNAKKICTYQNIFSSPLALIPSGMRYRPNNLKTQNKNHVVLFQASVIANCRPNATACLYLISLLPIFFLISFFSIKLDNKELKW